MPLEGTWQSTPVRHTIKFSPTIEQDNTVGQLLSTPLEDLFADRYFGPECYVEITERVAYL